MPTQNPSFALNVINCLKKFGFLEGPAVLVEGRFVIIGTTAKCGTAPRAFLSVIIERVGDAAIPGAETMLLDSLLNYTDGELVLRLEFATYDSATAFERNVMTLLEDRSDIVGKRLKFLEAFPTVRDDVGVFKLICVGISSPPAMYELAGILAEGETPDKGSVAIWATTENLESLGRFSFEVFDTCQSAAKLMVIEGVQVNDDHDMVVLARRCINAGIAKLA